MTQQAEIASTELPTHAPLGSPLSAPEPCTRCGAFGALEDLGERKLCVDCLARRHWIEREPATPGAIIRAVFHLTRSIGLPALVVLTLFDLPHLMVQFFFDAPWWALSLWGYISIIGFAACWGMAAQVVAGEPVAPILALRRAAAAWGRLAPTMFWQGLIIVLFALLLLIPGIMKMLSLTVALPIALHEGLTGSDAMAESERRTKGLRWPIFLATFAVTLAWLVPVVTVGVVAGALEAPIEWVRVAGSASALLFGLPAQLIAPVLYAKTRYREYEID